MGEGEAERAWLEDVRRFANEVSKRVAVEAVLVFGSAARSGLGAASDVDVLVVSDSFEGVALPDRIALLSEAAVGRIEALGYTYRELKSMLERANPLAVSALAEGLAVAASPRVRQLMGEARRKFRRSGRVWWPR